MQLAKRTVWLKLLIEAAGLGQDLTVEVASLNAITKTGFYSATATATGVPAAVPVAVVHIGSQTAAFATQIATGNGATAQQWFRRKSAGVWGTWQEILNAGKLQSSNVDTAAGRLLTSGAFGLGATDGVTVANCDSIPGPGFYVATTSTLNSPGSAENWAIIHSIGALNGGVQVAIGMGTERTMVRHKLGPAAWGSWRQIWTGQSPISQLAVNGYQRLPSGLILQWGSANTDAGGTAAITFPIAFPTAVFSIAGTDSAGSAEAGNAHILSAVTRSASGFLAMTTSWTGTVGPSNFNYFAVGH